MRAPDAPESTALVLRGPGSLARRTPWRRLPGEVRAAATMGASGTLAALALAVVLSWSNPASSSVLLLAAVGLGGCLGLGTLLLGLALRVVGLPMQASRPGPPGRVRRAWRAVPLGFRLMLVSVAVYVTGFAGLLAIAGAPLAWIGCAALAGVPIGMGLGILMAGSHAVTHSGYGARDRVPLSADDEGSVRIAAPAERVWEVVVDAVAALGVSREELVDPPSELLVETTRRGILGESLYVRLIPEGPHTTVFVHSRALLGTVQLDDGKNQRNVAAITDALSAAFP